MNDNTQLAKNKAGAEMYLPTTKSEAYKLAESFSQSSFCPASYRNKPAEVYLAMAYGAQVGLNPLLAVQNIAVVNGKPAVYGDALTAIAQGHQETEEYEDGYKDNGTAFCKITRKGRTIYREFSVEMAKRAGLWGKNTWAQYPERMLLWRARGWAVRDAFADVLMGLWSVEEAIDNPDRDITPRQETSAEPGPTKKADSLKNRIKGTPAEEAPAEQEDPREKGLFAEDGEEGQDDSSDNYDDWFFEE
ncbi:MAG: hypothetical protein K9L24_03695 [Spirochaetia bacterium]|nr:hypothetical protein [Spirochaetia bacterium]